MTKPPRMNHKKLPIARIVVGPESVFCFANHVMSHAVTARVRRRHSMLQADEHAERYGESNHEPPHLRERFVPYDNCPPIVRATLPAHAPKLLVHLLQSFSVLTR
jgi:hypothetical protein